MQSQNGIPEIAQGWPERIQQNLIRKCVIVPAIRGNHFQSSFQRSLNEYKHLKQAGKHLSGLATHLWRCFWKHMTKHIKVYQSTVVYIQARIHNTAHSWYLLFRPLQHMLASYVEIVCWTEELHRCHNQSQRNSSRPRRLEIRNIRKEQGN